MLTAANGDEPIATLGGGSFFGEMALLAADGKTKASVRVADSCVTMSLTRESYQSVCALHPSFKRYVESVARLRLRRMEMDPNRLADAPADAADAADDLDALMTMNKGTMRKKIAERSERGGMRKMLCDAPRTIASRLSVAAGRFEQRCASRGSAGDGASSSASSMFKRTSNRSKPTARERRWNLDGVAAAAEAEDSFKREAVDSFKGGGGGSRAASPEAEAAPRACNGNGGFQDGLSHHQSDSFKGSARLIAGAGITTTVEHRKTLEV